MLVVPAGITGTCRTMSQPGLAEVPPYGRVIVQVVGTSMAFGSIVASARQP